MMKKKTTRALAIALCVCLLACGTGAAYALSASKTTEQPAVTPDARASARTLDSDHTTAASIGCETGKDETVYVLTAADGSTQKVIVSDWLKNGEAADALNDASRLTDIETVKGDAAFTEDDDGSLVWDTKGGDVYYQGTGEEPLPVEMHVSYRLDGQPISPEELEGKSGHVSIRYSFENKQTQTVTVEGKEETVHVPFTVLTGLVMRNDVFTNISVTNGKIVNDGGRTAVVGLALPGLQEDLGLSPEQLKLPDYVEIEADTESFRLGMSVTLVSNELFTRLDPARLDPMQDDLSEALTALTDAMAQLTDGSSELYQGLETLLKKSGQLETGVEQLSGGAAALKKGAAQLDAGAGQVQDGAAQLQTGLKTLDANSSSLNAGAKQVFQTLLTTARKQLKDAGLKVPKMTISNYDKVLTDVIASLDHDAVYQTALNTVTAAVEAQRSVIREKVTAAVKAEVEDQVTTAVTEQVTAQVTEAVKEQVTAQVTEAVRAKVAAQVIQTATGLDADTYNAAVQAGQIDEAAQAAVEAAIEQQMETKEVRKQIKAAVKEQMSSDTVTDTIASNTAKQMKTAEVKALIKANVKEQMKSDKVKALIKQNTDAQVQKAIADAMAGDEVQAQLTAASEGAKEVIALKTSLDSYNAFYAGLKSYTAGVSQAAAGAARLKTGTDSLKAGSGKLAAGADTLANGAKALQDNLPALREGITALRDGAKALCEGLDTFNEQGIEKLTNAVDGDLAGLTLRLKALLEASGCYNNYAGIAEGMEGQVRFLYRTAEIGE